MKDWLTESSINRCLGIVCIFIFTSIFPAQSVAEIAGREIFPADELSSLRLVDEKNRFQDKFSLERFQVQELPFGEALRIYCGAKPENFWDVQLIAKSKVALRKSSTVYCSFWGRSVKGLSGSARGKIVCNFQRVGGDWLVLADGTVYPSSKWQQYDFLAVLDKDYEAGELRIAIPLGFGEQIIEIAGIQVRAYSHGGYIEELPTADIQYEGRQANALWRKQALDRIEKIRKGDLKFRIVNRNGQPVEAADVVVEMKRHAFLFGSAINVNFLNDKKTTNRDLKKYKATIEDFFNVIVFENSTKWPYWKQWESGTIEVLNWLQENEIGARGHCLMWPNWQHLPQDLKILEKQPNKIREKWLGFVKDITEKTNRRIIHWDVLNEPNENFALMDLMGRQEMVHWFKTARQYAPQAKLTLNETFILSRGGYQKSNHEGLLENCRFLLKNNAPLDAVGLQSHLDGNITPPERIVEVLDRYAKLGLRIYITEFDMKIANPKVQHDYMRDFMTAVFSHPNVDCFLVWGFWDGKHWQNWSPLFRQDWSLRPSGEAWMELVREEWWTQESGKTDRKGEYETRGFLGSYEITVQKNGKREKRIVDLNKNSSRIEIILDEN